jgi:hypothetical protein
VSYAVRPFYTYLSNFGFRVLLVVDPDTGLTQLGHVPAPLQLSTQGTEDGSDLHQRRLRERDRPEHRHRLPAALHAGGLIEYPDAVSGATCKRVTEDPSQLAAYGRYAPLIAGSCRYGQALGEAQGHYEETNSAGWDIANDMLDAIGKLTGSADATEVNPDFPGWCEKNLPPGDLP